MRKFIAIIFTIFLVFPLLFTAQSIVSVSSFILDRNFYVSTLNNEDVYETLVIDTLVPRIFTRGISLPADADTAQLKGLILAILDQEYFRSQTSNIVDNMFDSLRGKQSEFTPVIDLVPLKAALSGERRDEFLVALAQALPVCEPGQIPGFGGPLETACKPAGISDESLIENFLTPVLPLAFAQLPDQVLLVENWEELRSFRNYRSFIPGMAVPASLLLGGIIFTLVALSLWYITARVADDAWRLRLQWLGWTLMVPSGLIILVGIVAGSNIPVYWINYGLDHAKFGPSFGPGLREALRAIISGATPYISTSYLTVGGISAALSLGLIFWGLLTPSPTLKE